MVSFAGGELLAHGEHLLPACGRVVEHGVHRQQRHDAQNLLGTGVVGGQQDRLPNEAGSVTTNLGHACGRSHTLVLFCWRRKGWFTLAYLGSRGKLAIFFPKAVS